METDLHRSSVLSESAVLVQVHLPDSEFDHHDPLGELRALVESAGVKVAGGIGAKNKETRGGTYLGQGDKAGGGLFVCELQKGG